MGIYELVVERIYELCRERKITPNALSYMSGVSQSTVKSILNGESKNPGTVTIKKVCDGLEITLGEFSLRRSLICLSRKYVKYKNATSWGGIFYGFYLIIGFKRVDHCLCMGKNRDLAAIQKPSEH